MSTTGAAPVDPVPDMAPGAAPVGPAALADPVRPVRAGWVALLAAANLGVWMAFFAPVQILLPRQVELIDAAYKEALLGWVTGLGALVAIVANPLAGALSDRTVARRGRLRVLTGRRHVWTLGGAVLAAFSLVLLGRQQGILGVAIGWVCVQVCLNAMLASLTAAVPDRVPVAQRGAVSGWIGLPQAVAGVAGASLVIGLAQDDNAGGYLVLAVALVLLALPFTTLTEDHPLPVEHRPPSARLLRGVWRTFRDHPDFTWAFITRFLVQLGTALATLYLLYFLEDQVHRPHPERDIVVLLLLNMLSVGLSAVLVGRLSDRTGRRKIFVIGAGVLLGTAALLLAALPTWPVVVTAAVVLGIGYGAYMAVDAALITQVLPRATDRAKDLGVINIANAAPQVLGPALAAPIVVSPGGYPLLFSVTGAVTLLSGLLVTRIRQVP
ncbi:MFS transporter [Micromonospora sp. B11E3]|uniref:MFS transporter n=1 Tax=Micromonospora sp. B11E3 TaxID=3153562 RepID=UPI00325F4E93